MRVAVLLPSLLLLGFAIILIESALFNARGWGLFTYISNVQKVYDSDLGAIVAPAVALCSLVFGAFLSWQRPNKTITLIEVVAVVTACLIMSGLALLIELSVKMDSQLGDKHLISMVDTSLYLEQKVNLPDEGVRSFLTFVIAFSAAWAGGLLRTAFGFNQVT